MFTFKCVIDFKYVTETHCVSDMRMMTVFTPNTQDYSEENCSIGKDSHHPHVRDTVSFSNILKINHTFKSKHGP